MRGFAAAIALFALFATIVSCSGKSEGPTYACMETIASF